MKKIIISIMIVLTLFSSVSFAFDQHGNVYNLLKDKNSVEGSFLRQIFNEIVAYKQGFRPFHKADLVSAIEAVRLTTNDSISNKFGSLKDSEAIEIAKLLVKEIKER